MPSGDQKDQSSKGEEGSDVLVGEKAESEETRSLRLPYPWCIGAPTKQACIEAGYCKRNPNCGE